MSAIRLVVPFLSLAGLAAASIGWAQDSATAKSSPGKTVEIVNPIAGRATIVLLRPSGSWVKAGEMVCELDASALDALLAEQRIATKSAEANFQNARLTREVAEIAVTEYSEGIFKQDVQTIRGEIALALSDRERAEERLKWAQDMNKKGFVSGSQLTAEKLALEKALFALEQARTKENVLVKYTKDKTLKQLKAEVEKERATELSRQATLEREKAIQDRLESHLKKYKVVSPIDGRIDYPRSIEANTIFREGETLFRVVPDTRPGDAPK
jgi:multidrug resistance efflux pump